MEAHIRPAAVSDLAAINAIFSHYVLHSTATFEFEPISAARRRAWWDERHERYPILVAHTAKAVVGWAGRSPFRPAAGYACSAQNSVYLAPDWCGRGLGRRLMEELLRPERTAGLHAIIAGISADQTASIRLHARLNFAQVAHLREVGFKFGRLMHVVYMQKKLSATPGTPPT